MRRSSLERHRLILKHLREAGSVRISELRTLLEVSPMTVWRDVVALEDQQKLRRSHGRISRFDPSIIEPDFDAKQSRATAAKQRIAAYAAEHFLREGMALAVDGGTTVAGVALSPIPARLSIVSNSLFTAGGFLRHPKRPDVQICGGLVRETSGTIIGREALAFFTRRHFDLYLLSATGIDTEAGVTDLTLEDNEVKQAMAAASDAIVLLADRSKIGRRSLMEIFPLRRIHHLVTDASPEQVAPLCEAAPDLQVHHV